ncbi:MAG: patatin-like phospholipase family protein [Acidimicrobiia bacterium]
MGRRIGIVLGGGGVTGAAYEIAALMAIRLATGWEPDEAEVVIGTSAGSTVAALIRGGRLDVGAMVREMEDEDAVAQRITDTLYPSSRTRSVARWARRGLLPGLRSPGVSFVLGAPGRFDPIGIGDWIEGLIGPEAAGSWPDRPTVAVAFDLEERRRVAFGTEQAPDVSLRDAVSASSAVPIIFDPHRIDGRSYVDGGVASGTHADLVLAADQPLDLVIIIAPMAADEGRHRAYPFESLLDRVGRKALETELAQIGSAWPDTDVVVLRPRPAVLAAMRPNPMDPTRAVPTFVATLNSMKQRLASPEVWAILREHLGRGEDALRARN